MRFEYHSNFQYEIALIDIKSFFLLLPLTPTSSPQYNKSIYIYIYIYIYIGGGRGREEERKIKIGR